LTKACVRRAGLMITTDSGPRHFAAAFGVPTVTLFGPTHVAWSETYVPKAVHLQKDVECGPCQQRVCPYEHHKCMRELTVDTVFHAAVDLLRREGGTPPETAVTVHPVHLNPATPAPIVRQNGDSHRMRGVFS